MVGAMNRTCSTIRILNTFGIRASTVAYCAPSRLEKLAVNVHESIKKRKQTYLVEKVVDKGFVQWRLEDNIGL